MTSASIESTLKSMHNVITVTVTAQDDSSGVYTITINRAAASDDATLSELTFSGVTLSPAFAPSVINYTASVLNTVTETTASIAATDALAKRVTITSDQDSTISGDNRIDLAVGDNVITVTVTAQNDAVASYTITINRASSSTDTTLAALSFSGVTLSPAFASATRNYSATVDYVFAADHGNRNRQQ